jgi:signal recognition particle GTPase
MLCKCGNEKIPGQSRCRECNTKYMQEYNRGITLEKRRNYKATYMSKQRRLADGSGFEKMKAEFRETEKVTGMTAMDMFKFGKCLIPNYQREL